MKHNLSLASIVLAILITLLVVVPASAQDAPTAPSPFYTAKPVANTADMYVSDSTGIPGLGLIAREPGVRTVDYCSTPEEQEKIKRGDAIVCTNERNNGLVFMETQRIPCPENGVLRLDGAYFTVRDEDSLAFFPEVDGRARFVFIRCNRSDGAKGTVNGWQYVIVSNHNASQTGWQAYTWATPYVSTDQYRQLISGALGGGPQSGHGDDGSIDVEICDLDLQFNVMRCVVTTDGTTFVSSYGNEPK